MLPIANRPFLEHQVEHLRCATASTASCSPAATGPTRSGRTSATELEYVVEPEPLGTGGAIAYAARGARRDVRRRNGDVLTDLDLTALVALPPRPRARA